MTKRKKDIYFMNSFAEWQFLGNNVSINVISVKQSFVAHNNSWDKLTNLYEVVF